MRYHVRRIAKIFLVLSGFSPLALILLIKAIIWDWPMQRLARSAVKNTAAAMGLSYIPSQYIREFGELHRHDRRLPGNNQARGEH